MEQHYPERLARAVVYPVPSFWFYVGKACLHFLPRSIRRRLSFATEEQDLVQEARLLGPEQLPEHWRGGFHAVKDFHQPDASLLNSIIWEYLNPLAESSQQLLDSFESPWEDEASASALSDAAPQQQSMS
ncbi:unnamed protein product [Polarella glacialis]|uniref:CRAL-TRIO domain-containing protein n=1 Tax=Polarella glacialis TaxID=89957 RepID=A0A813G3W7_POLGL|nr:unnamed protein product [Polarella glacialis]